MKVNKCHPSAPVPRGLPEEGRQCLCLEQIPEGAEGWSSLIAKCWAQATSNLGSVAAV